MEDLLKLLNSIYPISQELQDHLLEILKVKDLPKKSFLLKAGHISQNICFIKKGLVRCFYTRNFDEVSSWFMKEGDFIISVESFFKQKPSNESIQAIEDCEMYCINYRELQNLYLTFPEFNLIGRVLTEHYYTLAEHRLYSIRMQRANEKYISFMEELPELVQRVPVKYVASYLGITEETLSRIRSRKY